MILDAMTVIETVSQSDSSPKLRKKQIDDYKEEVDFDYLVVEIGI